MQRTPIQRVDSQLYLRKRKRYEGPQIDADCTDKNLRPSAKFEDPFLRWLGGAGEKIAHDMQIPPQTL